MGRLPCKCPRLRFDADDNGLSSCLTEVQIAACPTCNKPLPKCAVCLLPLNCRTSSSQPSSGAGGGSVSRGDGNSGDNDGSLPFNDVSTGGRVSTEALAHSKFFV